jgi:hypothetical protein
MSRRDGYRCGRDREGRLNELVMPARTVLDQGSLSPRPVRRLYNPLPDLGGRLQLQPDLARGSRISPSWLEQVIPAFMRALAHECCYKYGNLLCRSSMGTEIS